jgi:hypothetical protein
MKSWIVPLAVYLIFPAMVVIVSISTQPTQPVAPVRIDVQCDSCQSYGQSVADAISAALQQSDKLIMPTSTGL